MNVAEEKLEVECLPGHSDEIEAFLKSQMRGGHSHQGSTGFGSHEPVLPKRSCLNAGLRVLHVLVPEPVFLHHKRQAKLCGLRFPEYIIRCLSNAQLSSCVPKQQESRPRNLG